MPEKILVVDDEQDIADLLEVYLQNEFGKRSVRLY